MRGQTDTTLTIVVACIAASAVLLGAIIAAITAGRRQIRQLAHESERQTEQLTHDSERQDRALKAESNRHAQTLSAEGERLARQLAHERLIADITEIRSLLDESAGALHRLFSALAEAITATDHGPKLAARVDEIQGSGAPAGVVLEAIESLKEVRGAQDRALALVPEVISYRDRISIRLAPEHPAGEKFHEAVNYLHEALVNLPRELRSLTGDELAYIQGQVDLYDAMQAEFILEANSLVGASLADGSPPAASAGQPSRSAPLGGDPQSAAADTGD